jgi:hypothetical protein
VGGNLTLDEVTGAETTPDATPRNYRELVDVLKCYCFVLQRMLGARCNHFREVLRAITRVLGQKRQEEFDGITARQVATVLWHIFMDARHFFSTSVDLSGSLPESNLRVARGMIETTMIPKQVNVPYEQLYCLAPRHQRKNESGGGGRGTGGQDPGSQLGRRARQTPRLGRETSTASRALSKRHYRERGPSTRHCKWLT